MLAQGQIAARVDSTRRRLKGLWAQQKAASPRSQKINLRSHMTLSRANLYNQAEFALAPPPWRRNPEPAALAVERAWSVFEGRPKSNRRRKRLA